MLSRCAAALVGLLIRRWGLLGSQLTGSALWDRRGPVGRDRAALLRRALILIQSNLSLLIGQAAPQGIETGHPRRAAGQPEVEDGWSC
ncbi:hypothetical protein GCM10020220_014920 [Nonomuraea rubra]|uniref:hypothetical protein n=1 Tax=Nonomuraea rubra TaxID=46180 RepID=UPI0031E63F9B